MFDVHSSDFGVQRVADYESHRRTTFTQFGAAMEILSPLLYCGMWSYLTL